MMHTSDIFFLPSEQVMEEPCQQPLSTNTGIIASSSVFYSTNVPCLEELGNTGAVKGDIAGWNVWKERGRKKIGRLIRFVFMVFMGNSVLTSGEFLSENASNDANYAAWFNKNRYKIINQSMHLYNCTD